MFDSGIVRAVGRAGVVAEGTVRWPNEKELRVCSAGESPRRAEWVVDTRYLRRLSFAEFSSDSSMSGHGALGSEERMRDSSASSSAPSLEICTALPPAAGHTYSCQRQQETSAQALAHLLV